MIKQLKIILKLLFIMSFSAPAPLMATPDLVRPNIIVPESIPGAVTLDSIGVIKIVRATEDLIIIDARIADDRNFGYLEGSISLPDIETNCETLGRITEDKTRPLLFYCNGVKCGRSAVSIKIARSCGYENLYWFKGGFEEWREKGFQYIKEN